MRVRPVGATALLLEPGHAADVEPWRAELWRRRAAGDLDCTDIVPGARTVLLDGVDPAVADRIAGWTPAPVTAAEGPLVELPVVFDGADLGDVADRWGVPPADVAGRLAGTAFTVAFCGFAPGFGYLRGLPPRWAVPRLPTPRPRVPAGSVGLADTWAGIYPGASPGGWRLVGRTERTLFDPDRDPPALLAPGTRVRLVPA